MSADTPYAVLMPNTNFKDLSDGDFALLLRDIGKTIETHPAYQTEVPVWVPSAQTLYRHGDSMVEAISACNRDKSKEPEKAAERKRGQQAINFMVQFLTMYAVHHDDPTALDIGIDAKQKKYNKDARRAIPGKMDKLEILEVKDERGEETDRLLFVISRLQEKGSVEIQYTDNSDDESSWQTFSHLYECRSFVQKGALERIKKYYFRGRYCSAGGNGPWSEVCKHVVL